MCNLDHWGEGRLGGRVGGEAGRGGWEGRLGGEAGRGGWEGRLGGEGGRGGWEGGYRYTSSCLLFYPLRRVANWCIGQSRLFGRENRKRRMR